MIHPEDDIPFGPGGTPDADEEATEDMVERMALAICGTLERSPFDQLHSCRQESMRLAADKALTAIMTNEAAITRAAEAMLRLYRTRNGLPTGTEPGTDLDAMRPDHRAEWIEDARAFLAAIAPDLAPAPGEPE